MQKLLLASFIAVGVFWSGYASAFGDGPFGPASGSDGVYWPAYRASYRAYAGEGCVRWNWQQLSYYDYCGYYARPSRGVVRVRG